MRKSNEILAELNAKMKAFESAEGEARAALSSEIDALTRELQEAQIDEAARRAIANQRTLSPAEKKELKRFSISKFLREGMKGNFEGLEAEMAEEGKKEFDRSIAGAAEGFFMPSFLRDLTYSPNATEDNYKGFAGEGGMTYVEALRNNMLGAKLGVQYIDGLVGNLAVVKGGAAAASWLAEEGTASVVKPTYIKAVMKPHRLQILQGLTYDILHQSPLAVDKVIMNDMRSAHAVALDGAIFAGSGESGQPTGIIADSGVTTVAIDTNGGPLTFAKLVELETTVGSANGLFGSLAYVTNAKVNGAAKTTPEIAGYPKYLFNEGRGNGYPVEITNAIPSTLTKGTSASVCSAAIFGNFNEILVGGWGGLQFIVDPYSEKEKGVIEISAHAYHDVLVRRPACFAKILDITTA